MNKPPEHSRHREPPGSMRRRPRRLRGSVALRDLVAETRIHSEQLIQPHCPRKYYPRGWETWSRR